MAYLSNVAVAPFFRGKGVGSRLVIAAKDCAKEYLGADWLFAHVDFDNQVICVLDCHSQVAMKNTAFPVYVVMYWRLPVQLWLRKEALMCN